MKASATMAFEFTIDIEFWVIQLGIAAKLNFMIIIFVCSILSLLKYIFLSFHNLYISFILNLHNDLNVGLIHIFFGLS